MLYVTRQHFNRNQINFNCKCMYDLVEKHKEILKFNETFGLLTKDRGEIYQHFVSKIYNGNIAEIGNFMGMGISYIIDICRKNHNKIYAFDKFYYPELEINLRRLNPDSEEQIVIAETKESVLASKMFSDNFFDLVFIDGDHSYQEVKNDILMWFPKVKIGGVISGDDYGHKDCMEVSIAVDELLKNVQVKNTVWSVFKSNLILEFN